MPVPPLALEAHVIANQRDASSARGYGYAKRLVATVKAGAQRILLPAEAIGTIVAHHVHMRIVAQHVRVEDGALQAFEREVFGFRAVPLPPAGVGEVEDVCGWAALVAVVDDDDSALVGLSASLDSFGLLGCEAGATTDADDGVVGPDSVDEAEAVVGPLGRPP